MPDVACWGLGPPGRWPWSPAWTDYPRCEAAWAGGLQIGRQTCATRPGYIAHCACPFLTITTSSLVFASSRRTSWPVLGSACRGRSILEVFCQLGRPTATESDIPLWSSLPCNNQPRGCGAGRLAARDTGSSARRGAHPSGTSRCPRRHHSCVFWGSPPGCHSSLLWEHSGSGQGSGPSGPRLRSPPPRSRPSGTPFWMWCFTVVIFWTPLLPFRSLNHVMALLVSPNGRGRGIPQKLHKRSPQAFPTQEQIDPWMRSHATWAAWSLEGPGHSWRGRRGRGGQIHRPGLAAPRFLADLSNSCLLNAWILAGVSLLFLQLFQQFFF